jgi:uncharacterized membrane protein
MIRGLSPLDAVALAFFLAVWLGYSPYVRRYGDRKAAGAMLAHRLAWMQAMLGREVREVDSLICGNIMNSGSFFATAAVVVAGALLGVLVNLDGKNAVLEVKIVLILAVALYAFIAFTWSIRQANYLNVAIGAAPAAPVDAELRDRIAANMANIISHVASSYDAGMRAYYFGLAAVGWIVSPVMFLAGTAGIVALLLRRQSHSATAISLEHLAVARERRIRQASGATTYALRRRARPGVHTQAGNVSGASPSGAGGSARQMRRGASCDSTRITVRSKASAPLRARMS